eukprot:TRINITY_DN1726_c0_g1_i12.p1 TRINITY_DN1726_c0_g1~~TRINITY_DN1726_c0_g1_i12.p1  ORF type:complete len:268 (+),score=22.55 TRINITY_DN1726_c0_g1_i12:43-846(+)
MAVDTGGKLVEEGAEWFTTLIENVKKEISSPTELIAFAIHGFMLDLNFIVREQNIEKREIPSSWKTSAGIVFKYNYKNTEVQAQITIFNLGKFIQIHGFIPSASESFTVCLKQGDEFVNDNFELVNVKRLATIFKSQVGEKMQHKSRLVAGLERGLLQLPDDVIHLLFTFMDYKSVIRLSLTSSRLYELGMDKSIWRRLCKLNKDIQLEPNQDPYTVFSDHIRRQKLVDEKIKKMRAMNFAIEQRRREMLDRNRRIFPPHNPFFPDF